MSQKGAPEQLTSGDHQRSLVDWSTTLTPYWHCVIDVCVGGRSGIGALLEFDGFSFFFLLLTVDILCAVVALLSISLHSKLAISQEAKENFENSNNHHQQQQQLLLGDHHMCCVRILYLCMHVCIIDNFDWFARICSPIRLGDLGGRSYIHVRRLQLAAIVHF
ncbi:hypothetical protein T07_7127 [Trichinella nelsoni]|uniref:Uncharacterized protein n=1 Tax=Trichinella nelsoni TaxID=6336 RepID=A0A0V0S956_9BILA|nr:hypothetical protein T07_7127 [Trichinella nelsoni]